MQHKQQDSQNTDEVAQQLTEVCQPTAVLMARSPLPYTETENFSPTWDQIQQLIKDGFSDVRQGVKAKKSYRYKILDLTDRNANHIITLYIDYRERKIRRNMLSTNPMQRQVRCCQIRGRRRKREENNMSGP